MASKSNIPRLVHSPSVARTFAECRWRFRETRIRGRKGVESPYYLAGRLEHQVIEQYLRHLVAAKKPSDPSAVERIWRETLALAEHRVQDDEAGDLREIFARFSQGFLLDLDRVWEVEADLALDGEGRPCEFFGDQVWLRGKADLVLVGDGAAEIEDWKLARAPLTDAEVREDLQAQTYALFLFRFNPLLREVTVRFRYVRYGFSRSASFLPDDADRIWARWQAIDAAIQEAVRQLARERIWAPTPGGHCVTCPVVTTCPLGADLSDLAVADEASAQLAAQRLLVLEQTRKALRDRLSAWVDGHGPIQAGDQEWGYHQEDSWEYDAEAVSALLREHGYDPMAVLKVDGAAAKKLLKDPRLAGLAQLRQDAGRVVFKAKKINRLARNEPRGGGSARSQ